MSILIATLSDKSSQSWKDGFERHIEKFEIKDKKVQIWPNVENLDEIKYFVVWKPEEGICEQIPNAKAIFNLGAGVDHLLQDKSLTDGLPILRIVDENLTQRMGEYVMLQVLYHFRSMPKMQAQQKAKIWEDHGDPAAHEVNVGIMGLGEIGGYCAKLLSQVGFTVSGWSNSSKNIENVTSFAGQDQLNPFLNQCDILINLLPHTKQTDSLIGLNVFRELRQDGPLNGPIFINAGRGKSHVEVDIIEAIKTGVLNGASLDVFEVEPLSKDSELWDLDNVVLTPHNAAASDRNTVTCQILEQIENHEQGKAFINVVDRNKGY